MSTLTISAVRTPASSRLRLTIRGRRVLTAMAALPAAFALTAAFIAGGAALADANMSPATASFTTVTVSSGESLWSIAQRVAPQADPRDVVDGIVRLNALDGVTVSAGQRVAIPSQYASAP